MAVIALAASMAIYLLNSLAVFSTGLHRSIILIDWVTTVLAASLLRSAIRLGIERSDSADQPKRKLALIYGADKDAIGLLRSIRVSVPEFKIVGLIDTTGAAARSLIGGIPTISCLKGVARIAQRLSAGYLLVPSSVSGTIVRKLCRLCHEAGLKEPEFRMADGFTLTLWRTKDASTGAESSGKTSGKASGKTSGIVSGTMSGKIVRLMKDKPDITIPEIARRLKRTSRAIEMQINKLKADEIIGRIGPAKGGHWEVLK